MAKHSGFSQFYIRENKPSGNSAKELFKYCLKNVIERRLFSEALMHNQWASKLFSYEKNSDTRIDNMSKVKREYSAYFTHNLKYSFDKEKLKRDFPSFFGIKDDEDDSSDSYVRQTIKVLGHEILEQSDPHNIESFKGGGITLVRRQGSKYIYQVQLELSDGQEPHFRDGIPFLLSVYGKHYSCEAVEFDYESGLLYFISNYPLGNASYCKILLDSTFILEGLRSRLKDIAASGIDEDLPFAKFLFGETDDLMKIEHKAVPEDYKKGLDKSQRKAFDAAIDNDITFIWGPPGTGKSYTLASIIYTLFQLGEDRTVVCCISNVAVDQLLCKVLDIIEGHNQRIVPGNIYRAGRTIDSRIISTDYLFPNDQTTLELRSRIKKNIDALQVLKELKKENSEAAILLKADNKEQREKLREHTDFLVKSSRLVFSTISNFILSDTLYNSKFDNLIIDEASMMAMPSLLALGNKISKRLIMVGDFQQLSPIAIVRDDILTESVFDISDINIRNTMHPALHQLLNQRRSNEKIVELINKTFYEGRLIPAAEENTDIIERRPFGGRIITLKKVTDGAVRFTKGGTRQNKRFAESVIELLDIFYSDREEADKFTIGIITPYKGQVSLLRALVREKKYDSDFEKRVKIGTIHTFQGSECDVIIFDMVDCPVLESGRRLNIGKLYSGKEGERLLNVAVSRAKHKLILVCDPDYIKNIPGNTISQQSRSLFNKLSRFS